MPYSALLLGSICVLADTSDLQRQAFNTAFAAQDIDWYWDRQTYQELLHYPGGVNRLITYAGVRGHEVDVNAIYESKVRALRDSLESQRLELRPGIADLIAAARASHMMLGFVTSTDKR